MEWLASVFRKQGLDPAFHVLEVGALPLGAQVEPFHRLLKSFPGSRLTGLEIDPHVCADLNRKAAPGVHYYPCALGGREEKRHLYETAHPMCTSLYPPDERYADLFNNLEVMRLKSTREIATVSLDRFALDHDLGAIDMLKIDIQGAELEVMRGGSVVMRDLVFVICEVEFVPLYQGQPLFGDIDAYVRGQGMAFHKFLGMAGRVMQPLTAHGQENYPVQHLWSDALFVRDLFSLDTLSAGQLLKSALLLDLYDSKDVALHVLRHYDERHGSRLGAAYLDHLNVAGAWKSVTPESPQQS